MSENNSLSRDIGRAAGAIAAGVIYPGLSNVPGNIAIRVGSGILGESIPKGLEIAMNEEIRNAREQQKFIDECVNGGMTIHNAAQLGQFAYQTGDD